MIEYHPDNWVILKISINDDSYYKVLAGWSGGYLDGDSWRINSGISEIKEDDNYYYFYGASGSVYKCHKKSERLRMNNSHIYQQLKDNYKDQVEMVSAVDIEGVQFSEKDDE